MKQTRRVRVLLMTGSGRRHAYVASVIAGACDLVGCVREVKAEPPAIATAENEVDRQALKRHFCERDEVERRLLESAPLAAGIPELAVESGMANAASVQQWVRDTQPEVVLLYGTSIIRPPLLAEYAGRIVNLHLGLSPYYRGAGTNFWPFVEGELECVGSTIHLATEDVDGGPILVQVRPEWAASDRIHEAGTKALIAGARALRDAVVPFLDGRWVPVQQRQGIRAAYRRKDFNANVLRKAWEALDSGIVARYLASKSVRDAGRPIIERQG